MIAWLMAVASGSTKGIEYVIAILGLLGFLLLLRFLKAPEEKKRSR